MEIVLIVTGATLTRVLISLIAKPDKLEEVRSELQILLNFRQSPSIAVKHLSAFTVSDSNMELLHSQELLSNCLSYDVR